MPQSLATIPWPGVSVGENELAGFGNRIAAGAKAVVVHHLVDHLTGGGGEGFAWATRLPAASSPKGMSRALFWPDSRWNCIEPVSVMSANTLPTGYNSMG